MNGPGKPIYTESTQIVCLHWSNWCNSWASLDFIEWIVVCVKAVGILLWLLNHSIVGSLMLIGMKDWTCN